MPERGVEPAGGHVILSYFLQTRQPPQSATQIHTGSKCVLFLHLGELKRHSPWSPGSPSLTSLDLVARMLPFFSNSDRSGEGGGVAFWQRDFFWQLESFAVTDDSGTINLVDPTAWKVTEPIQEIQDMYRRMGKCQLSFSHSN